MMVGVRRSFNRRFGVGLLVLGGCRLSFEQQATVDARPDAPPGYFFVGGTVSAQSVAGLVLQLNGTEELRITSAGPFLFATPLAEGTSYVATLKTPPTGHECVMSHATGAVSDASVAEIEVTCFAAGLCPTSALTYTSDDTFMLPAGCAQFTVDVLGGGGAGGGKNASDQAAAGGAGGRALKTLTGQAAGTTYAITIGRGGTCESTTDTVGGYAGGKGGVESGFGDGGDGAGAAAPPGGFGGAGSTSSQPGGAGGNGGYGGGGGGGGGDVVLGNSGGGATLFALVSPLTELVIAGGGGGAGAADQNGDRAGAGGSACNGVNGMDGQAVSGGTRSGGGGGGGACFCLGGCDMAPTPTGGAAGAAAASGACTAAQNGGAGRVVITFP